MQAKPKPDAESAGKPAEEAEFLVEEFDLTEREASELVTEGDSAATEAQAAVQKKRKQRAPLGNAPVPEAPDSDFTADSDEDRLKPVVRTRNDRTGAG
ncbi:MAG TPA: hypothetical protein VGN80_01400 [Devosiaceae bacterium]|jgi:hypothetical protein|nr:hypothetical protein [Devosiaceae bacterium]